MKSGFLRFKLHFLFASIRRYVQFQGFFFSDDAIIFIKLIAMQRILGKSCGVFFQRRYGFSELTKFQNNFLTTTNLSYIEGLYSKWTVDKSSVSPSFAAYFELLEGGHDPHDAVHHPSASNSLGSISAAAKQIGNQLKMRLMIDGYRSIGHQFAKIDPLDLPQNKNLPGRLPDSYLSATDFGYRKQEMNDSIIVRNLREEGPEKDNGPYTIQAFEDYLRNIYCDKIGFQYMHLLSKAERDFLKRELEEKIESLQKTELTKEQQLSTLRRLARDQSFIDFLGNKFGNFKRFGIEGVNSATTGLGQLVESAAQMGVENIQVGMAHRGRLNALHCVFQKPAQIIFREFLEKIHNHDRDDFSGDVKYHLGYIHKKKFGDKEVTLSILPNPSHLEAVNPLVYGSTRALQEEKDSKDKVLGVLIHGDAAVAGQGVVWQSLGFQDLVDYSPGGIIHIVINNQIGFTTNPSQSRSSYYCTEVAKAVDAPVIHVNADEPDILDKCMKIAVEYRQKFKKDIFIDIVGYRRYGHNEQDMPNFTQPLMYDKIKSHPNVFELYSQKLIQKGVIDAQGIKALQAEFTQLYEADYKKVISDQFDTFKEDDLAIRQIKTPALWGKSTGVPRDVLTTLFHKITNWPSDFHVHPTIRKIYEERIKNFSNKQHLDWATMQSLSWATLLHEGYGVRVSGQDVERGTFSHRHAYISDQQRDVEKHAFLKTISNNVRITNSHLSEYGVLGFEYGYSITNPNTLVIWEAQFGDFANGAAIMIDNFIVSGETKWDQQSGIVLSLPHGMDGQGPEHSQARIERFLHLSDDNCDQDQSQSYESQMRSGNIQIICCSTTSNYFHAMRRQLNRDYRKPLIAFNSKKLLKFKGANRPIEDIIEGTSFTTVYPDAETEASKVKKVLFCHGQFYYDLKNRREELKRDDVAIIRIEQIAPFPHEAIKSAISKYGDKTSYYWVQEEHENYGVWNFIYPRLKLLLRNKSIGFHGRPASASTAVGALKLHKQEESALLERIFLE